ncbi:uncharacterized protein DUF177 involved in 23S rRNA accumulation [Dongia mobilis]|uniref:Uncharacterized protein DUF177 involved in 23S rRNA accumulation n=1 Tax=Dongia mobilis TaxID=578943 RepID=A0A4R6WR76_9PROT|nr:uncharacterized protein DUF177 involved in 23S rRNA accumulation [Dongia mobilis]
MSDNKEFTALIDVASIGPRPVRRQIATTPADRAAIAQSLGLLALNALTAELSLRRTPAGQIELTGELQAEVEQACVVTLEPVAASISESFRMRFAEDAAEPDLAEIDLDFEAADPPDPIVGGTIDLGQVVVEHLALALDPYPRKPDAALSKEFEPKPDELPEAAPKAKPDKTHRPFSGLDKLLK